MSSKLSKFQVDALAQRGINEETAQRFGIRPITSADELPDECPKYWTAANGYLPGLLIPWVAEDGRVEYQLRPDSPPRDGDGSPMKYVTRSREDGFQSMLWVAKRGEPGGRRILTEGTFQTVAAATYAAEGDWVLGMFGCSGWEADRGPLADLALLSETDVVVVIDADLQKNRDVWDSAERLKYALEVEGATSVLFVRLPDRGNAGLDDVLGRRPAGARATYLAGLIKKAENYKFLKGDRPNAKPVDNLKRPEDGRPVIVVNEDRYLVINALRAALVNRWDRTRLFNYGGVVCERDKLTMSPVTKEQFNDVLQETAMTISRTKSRAGSTGEEFTWPDSQSTGAVLSRAKAFSELEKLSQIPFVRSDGTVCATQGYDETSRAFLALAPELEGISVPAAPTPGEVKAAAALLTDDLLQGFPFPTRADMANAVATILTPFIRDLVPVSPLAVVDGKEAGSGKNLFADVISIIVTGRAAQPLPYSTDDAEQRKVVTSAFRTGTTMFVFDEAHRIEGPSMARALTSHTYQDRMLGGNLMAEFPNNVTWMSLGNQVQVHGDMGRRVYRVRMDYPGESPENRPESDFKHPDLRGWALSRRADLVRACLTMVRAWFAAGRPKAVVPFRMGSFETWQDTIGGILANAGVTGFLAGMKDWRSESDFERQHWVSHLAWLYDTFGDREFTAAEVRAKLLNSRDVAEYPHDLTDATKSDFTRELGKAYRRQAGRRLDGFTLCKLEGSKHGKVGRWSITANHDAAPATSEESEESEETRNPSHTVSHIVSHTHDAHDRTHSVPAPASMREYADKGPGVSSDSSDSSGRPGCIPHGDDETCLACSF